MKPVLVLNGPNLNLLGLREPQVYGTQTLAEIERDLRAEGAALGVELVFFQSNHEGALIDRLHEARGKTRGALLNPGGLSHTSVSLRDAVAAMDFPTIEVHISNTFAREGFRRLDRIAPVCHGVIAGLGAFGYRAGLRALLDLTPES